MGIQLTENAAKQIKAQLAKRGRGLGLRVGVKTVGCSGYAYTYDYADAISNSLSRLAGAKKRQIQKRSGKSRPVSWQGAQIQ